MVFYALYTTLWCNYHNNKEKPKKTYIIAALNSQKNVNDMREKP